MSRPGARDREPRRHPGGNRPRLVGHVHGRSPAGSARAGSASTSRPAELAEEACRIEIDVLGRPVGKQDQYVAAFGGVTCFEFQQDGSVDVTPLELSNTTMHELEERLLMFFTGSSRTADALLDDQRKRTEADDASMLEGLRRVEEIGVRIRDALTPAT